MEATPIQTDGSPAVDQEETRNVDLGGEIDYSEIPPTLVATNVPDSVYLNSDQKVAYSAVHCGSKLNLRRLAGPVTFHYFKSFHRVRVSYQTGEESLAAKLALDKSQFCGQEMGVYFIKVRCGNSNLEPPEPDRLFFLSPPASPPVGWAPKKEAEPVVNYDLLSALTTLAPGESHELHPAAEDKPQIVVHTCESMQPSPKLKITQTRRPEI